MKPLFELILIETDKEDKEKKSSGGIIYPNQEKSYKIGTVIDTGFNVDKSFCDEIKLGVTKVIYRESNPISIKENGKEYHIIHQKNVLSSFEENSKNKKQ